MTVRSMLLAVAVLWCAPGSQGDDKVPDPLMGEWVAVRVSGPNGKDLPKDALAKMRVTWTFQGGGKAIFSGTTDQGRAEAKYTYTTDPSKSPSTIDLTVDGMKQFGIYKIEKGTLTLCLSEPRATEDARPKEFAVGDTGILLELVRPEKK